MNSRLAVVLGHFRAFRLHAEGGADGAHEVGEVDGRVRGETERARDDEDRRGGDRARISDPPSSTFPNARGPGEGGDAEVETTKRSSSLGRRRRRSRRARARELAHLERPRAVARVLNVERVVAAIGALGSTPPDGAAGGAATFARPPLPAARRRARRVARAVAARRRAARERRQDAHPRAARASPFAAARRVAPRALVVASRVGGASAPRGPRARPRRPRRHRPTPGPATFPSVARRGGSTAAAASAASNGVLPAWTRPSWDVRVLFDGDCPLCVREVDFLRARDDGRGRLDRRHRVRRLRPPRQPRRRLRDRDGHHPRHHPRGRHHHRHRSVRARVRRRRSGVGVRVRQVPRAPPRREPTYDFWAERKTRAVRKTGHGGGDGGATRARDAAGGATACSLRDAACGETTRSDTPDRLDGFRPGSRTRKSASSASS